MYYVVIMYYITLCANMLPMQVGKHDEPAATGHECIVRKTLILLTGITAFLGIMVHIQ